MDELRNAIIILIFEFLLFNNRKNLMSLESIRIILYSEIFKKCKE